MRPLNYRQRLFVESYLGDSSQSADDAARRAGYQWPEKQGPRLVEKRQVRAAIDTGAATAGMAASEVLARLADVASADLLDLMAADDILTYSLVGRKTKLMPKAEWATILGHSPDVADALIQSKILTP